MIAIAFALEFEGAYFRAKHNPRLRVGIWLLGAMGPAVAQNLEKKLESNQPSLVISAGFAGGLQPGLPIGDLLIGTNQSDPRIVGALSLGEGWHQGPLLTEAAIVERAEDKRRLAEHTGCLAVDLETAHMAKVCAARKIPMLSVRCISDAEGDDMPVPADLLMSPQTGRPEPLQLFRHLVGNPSSVAGFNRLLKNAKIAQTRLAEGLDEILPQLLRIS